MTRRFDDGFVQRCVVSMPHDQHALWRTFGGEKHAVELEWGTEMWLTLNERPKAETPYVSSRRRR